MSPTDEARILHSECEVLENIFTSRFGSVEKLKDLLFSAQWERTCPHGYGHWVSKHTSNEVFLHSNGGRSNLSFRCPKFYCTYYIYGFSTVEKLCKHLDEEHSQRSNYPAIVQQEQPHSSAPNDALSLSDEAPQEPVVSTEFVYHSFEDGVATKRKVPNSPSHVKRFKKTTEQERDNVKLVREKGPCMRCKVLKKQVYMRLL